MSLTPTFDKYTLLKSLIEQSKHIVVFTGAGISVPSGIPDFRSANGLYNQSSGISYSPEEIISHSFFYAHTEEFYDFYKKKMCYVNAKPNLAHIYFGKLSETKDVAVVTQNIDGLHQAGGSKEVYELHGSIHRNYCTHCHKFYSLEDILKKDGIPYCDSCHSIIKPDVVLYEEGLDELVIQGALQKISNADLLIVVGTSLVVYPAASFIRYFRGKYLVLINKSKTQYDSQADLIFNEDVIDVIKKIS